MKNNYYQKHKERLKKNPCEIYQNLYKEEKDKRHKEAQEIYQNFTKEEKGKGVIRIFLRKKSRS